MARARNIKHGLYLNEELAELSIFARYLFPCLWCLCDKEGRMEYRPRKIKAEAYPYDDVDIPALLIELHEKQFISVYGNGTRAYIQVNGWAKHQNPHPKEKASDFPSINDELSITASIGFGEGKEKQFIFAEKNEKQRSTSDSIPSDSIPSSSLAEAESGPMERKEFVRLYEKTFGKLMPGGLNTDCDRMCAEYTPERIREAFCSATDNQANSFAYIRKVLTNKREEKAAAPQVDIAAIREAEIAELRAKGIEI